MSERIAANGIAGHDQAVDDIFLTPRVIDEGAFGHYSSALKELIRDAGGQGQQLRDFHADARQLVDDADRSGSDLRKKLELGTRLLSAVDGRITKVQTMLGEADKVADAESKVQAVIETKLAELEAKAEQIEQRLRSADRAAATTAANLTMLNTELEDKLIKLEKRTDSMVEKAGHAGQVLGEQIGVVLEKVQAESQDLTELIGPLRTSVDQAFELIGVDPEHPDKAAGGLHALIERGEALADRAEQTAGQLGSLRKQADEAVESFGRTIINATEKMDTIEARSAAIDASSGQRFDKMLAEAPGLMAGIETAGTEIDRVRALKGELDAALAGTNEGIASAANNLQNQAGQLDALVAGSVRRFNEQAEQAGQWLGGIVSRAEAAAARLEQASNQPTQPIASPAPPAYQPSAPPAPAQPAPQTAIPQPARPAARPPWQPREIAPSMPQEAEVKPVQAPQPLVQPTAPQRPVLRAPIRPIDATEFNSGGQVFRQPE